MRQRAWDWDKVKRSEMLSLLTRVPVRTRRGRLVLRAIDDAAKGRAVTPPIAYSDLAAFMGVSEKTAKRAVADVLAEGLIAAPELVGSRPRKPDDPVRYSTESLFVFQDDWSEILARTEASEGDLSDPESDVRTPPAAGQFVPLAGQTVPPAGQIGKLAGQFVPHTSIHAKTGDPFSERDAPAREATEAEGGEGDQAALPDVAAVEFPPELDRADVREWTGRWIAHRRRLGKPATALELQGVFSRFAPLGAAALIGRIDFAIQRGWEAVMPAPEQPPPEQPRPGVRHDRSSPFADSVTGIYECLRDEGHLADDVSPPPADGRRPGEGGQGLP